MMLRTGMQIKVMRDSNIEATILNGLGAGKIVLVLYITIDLYF